MAVDKRGRLEGDWMAEVVRELEERGEMHDLPGKGKPLVLPDEGLGDPAEAAANRILKEANFLPEWIELQKAIRAELNWLREHPAAPEFAARLVAVNKQIDRFNLLVPSPTLQLPRVRREWL